VIESNNSISYGCIFCMSGREDVVVSNIHHACENVHALSLKIQKHMTKQGKKYSIFAPALPGYVFFEAPTHLVSVCSHIPKEGLIRVLTNHLGDWRLQDRDEEFAKWVFQNHGTLHFSKAYQEGERVRILSGPLKEMEGYICRIDRRGRSGQIEIKFNGRLIKVWLGFEWIDSTWETPPQSDLVIS
jgi:transcription antitermination factor NusG